MEECDAEDGRPRLYSLKRSWAQAAVQALACAPLCSQSAHVTTASAEGSRFPLRVLAWAGESGTQQMRAERPAGLHVAEWEALQQGKG